MEPNTARKITTARTTTAILADGSRSTEPGPMIGVRFGLELAMSVAHAPIPSSVR